MKKIESKLWDVYVCTPEEMDVVAKRKSHRKLEDGKKLVSYHTTLNRKSQYYIDGEYFDKNIKKKKAVTQLILSNEFININENMTEEDCKKRATEVLDSLINEVLKNL